MSGSACLLLQSATPGVVQVAGFADEAEARMLDACGVDLLGLPLRLDVNRPDMSEALAAGVLAATGLGPRTVLITYDPDPASIVALSRELGVGAVQLHGDATPKTAEGIRSRDPDLAVLKSLVIRPQGAGGSKPEDIVTAFAPVVDVFITDTYDPTSGASGATGKTHDWAVSRRLVELSPKPVILAGGLNPDNVAEAIATVRPWGVDAHTGLEGPDGRKDEAKVLRFVQEAKRAFGALGRKRVHWPRRLGRR